MMKSDPNYYFTVDLNPKVLDVVFATNEKKIRYMKKIRNRHKLYIEYDKEADAKLMKSSLIEKFGIRGIFVVSKRRRMFHD